MKSAAAFDTARLGIMLAELRLPTIKLVRPQFAEQADKEVQAACFRRRLPSTNSRNGIVVGPSAISPRAGCRRARPSTASTSTPCR